MRLQGAEEIIHREGFARSARFAARWFEFDVGWLYIRMLAALRLAKVLHARTGPGRATG